VLMVCWNNFVFMSYLLLCCADDFPFYLLSVFSLFFAGTDAILKDPNDDFKIIDFVHLVKISS
jgi:hypothetical protein